MSRRTVNIKIQPQLPESFLELCQNLIDRNTQLGSASPLADNTLVNMDQLNDLTTLARQKRNEALEHYAIAEAAMFESRRLIGYAPGQTVITEDTLYNLVINAKQALLVLNRQNPEALSLWGFDVVVKTSRKTGPKKKR